MHRPISWFGVAACRCSSIGALSANSLHAQSLPAQTIEIDTTAPSHPFPHFWERIFGSGRAFLSLRDGYRNDLRETKRITWFRIRSLPRHLPR